MALPLCLLVGGLHPDTRIGAFLTAGGEINPLGSFTGGGESPSYIAFSADMSRAYVANHNIPTPGVTAVRLGWSTGSQGCLTSVTPLQPLVPAPDPCHVAVHPSGQYLFTASYSQGSVSVYPIAQDGTLGPPKTTALGENAHMASFAMGGAEVLVPLLGSDAVAVLGFNASSGSLALQQMLALPPGSGPRHLAMHPTLLAPPTGYLVLERGNSVVQITRSSSSSSSSSGEGGTWGVQGAPMSTLRTSPPPLPPTIQAAAALAISPDARFLYVSNRASPSGTGDNSIATLALGNSSGSGGGEILGPPVSWATGGLGAGQSLLFPRDFSLSQDGRTLVVASQLSGTLTLFSRDEATGALGFLACTPSSPLQAPSFVHLGGPPSHNST